MPIKQKVTPLSFTKDQKPTKLSFVGKAAAQVIA
jgi:hypothetical protein